MKKYNGLRKKNFDLLIKDNQLRRLPDQEL